MYIISQLVITQTCKLHSISRYIVEFDHISNGCHNFRFFCATFDGLILDSVIELINRGTKLQQNEKKNVVDASVFFY